MRFITRATRSVLKQNQKFIFGLMKRRKNKKKGNRKYHENPCLEPEVSTTDPSYIYIYIYLYTGEYNRTKQEPAFYDHQ